MLLSVTLMSPPALLHAIPVERFPVIETAARLKVWFLVTAAAWRFALLRSVTELPCLVVAIVPCFAACNLEHVPFDVMTGLQKGECGRNDCADMLRLRNYDASRRFEPPPSTVRWPPRPVPSRALRGHHQFCCSPLPFNILHATY